MSGNGAGVRATCPPVGRRWPSASMDVPTPTEDTLPWVEPNLELPEPARYFPIERGRYEVLPGLKPLGSDLGNGSADGKVFQVDSDFRRFHAEKLAVRAERLDKYVCEAHYDSATAAAVGRLILGRLCEEHRDLFRWHVTGDGGGSLSCRLTGEILRFDDRGNLRRADKVGGATPEIGPPYRDTLDALACQVQEDLAVVRLTGDRNWLASIHLCFPNHWAAEEKIGRDFAAIHEPVAGIETINRAAPAIVRAMVHKGPFVRFAWGIASDARLNHHPEPPRGVPAAAWHGRYATGGDTAEFFLRVERQVVWGLPAVGASLFTIRTYFVSGAALSDADRNSLRSALHSMTPEQREYKGIAATFSAVLSWIDRLDAAARPERTIESFGGANQPPASSY
jgi:dimethylamine monooxygenase subunit A